MNDEGFQRWTSKVRGELYCNPGWVVVSFAEYFENTNSLEASNHIRKKFVPWCQNYLHLDSWALDGVTKHSYRIQFKNSEDALLFKLIWLSK